MPNETMFTYTPAHKDEQNLFILKQALKYVSISTLDSQIKKKQSLEQQRQEILRNTLGPLNKLPTKDPKIPNPYIFYIDIPSNHPTLVTIPSTYPLAIIGDYRIVLTDKLGESKVDLQGNLQFDRKFNMDTFTLPTIITKQPTRFVLLKRILELLGGITKEQFAQAYPEIKILNANDVDIKNMDKMEQPLLSYFTKWFPDVSQDEYHFIHAKIAYIRFGALLITSGSRVLDDYWEQLLTNQGFSFRDRVFLIPDRILKKAKKILGNTQSTNVHSMLPQRNEQKTPLDLKDLSLENPYVYINEQSSMELKKAYCNYQQQGLYFKSVSDGEKQSDLDSESIKKETPQEEGKEEEDITQPKIDCKQVRRPHLDSETTANATIRSLQRVIVSGQNITGGIELSSQSKFPRYSTKIAYLQSQRCLNVPIGDIIEQRSNSNPVAADYSADQDDYSLQQPGTPPVFNRDQNSVSAQSTPVFTQPVKNKRLLSSLLGDVGFQQSKKVSNGIAKRYWDSGDDMHKNTSLNLDPWKFETLSLRKQYGFQDNDSSAEESRLFKYNSKGLPIFNNEMQLINRLKHLTPQQVVELSHQHDSVQVNKNILNITDQRDAYWKKYWKHKCGLVILKKDHDEEANATRPIDKNLDVQYIRSEIDHFEKVLEERYDPDTNSDIKVIEKREPDVNFKGFANITGYRPPYAINLDEA